VPACRHAGGPFRRGICHPPSLLPHSAFRIPHSAFRIPHSAFRIPHSELSGSGKGSVSLAAIEHGLLDREPGRNAEADRRPYDLVLASDDDWCLIAYCHLRDDIRLFKVQRVRSAEETGA